MVLLARRGLIVFTLLLLLGPGACEQNKESMMNGRSSLGSAEAAEEAVLLELRASQPRTLVAGMTHGNTFSRAEGSSPYEALDDAPGCPEGAKILSSEQCEKAATALGATWDLTNSAGRVVDSVTVASWPSTHGSRVPPGCSMDKAKTHANWNTDNTGVLGNTVLTSVCVSLKFPYVALDNAPGCPRGQEVRFEGQCEGAATALGATWDLTNSAGIVVDHVAVASWPSTHGSRVPPGCSMDNGKTHANWNTDSTGVLGNTVLKSVCKIEIPYKALANNPGCDAGKEITSAKQCRAAAAALGVTWSAVSSAGVKITDVQVNDWGNQGVPKGCGVQNNLEAANFNTNAIGRTGGTWGMSVCLK